MNFPATGMWGISIVIDFRIYVSLPIKEPSFSMIWITEIILAKLSTLHIIFGVRCCLSVLFVLYATAAIYGAEEQATTGARAIGMGGAFIGVADDENAVRQNPAGLPRLDRYAVGFETDALWVVQCIANKLSQRGLADFREDGARH